VSRGPNPLTVELSVEEKAGLEKIACRPSTAQQVAQRARVVLAANEGHNNAEIARAEGTAVNLARKWRRRWVELQSIPGEEMSLEERLRDLTTAPPLYSCTPQEASSTPTRK
jgi:putative transposase